jgi:tetratricopeptide (TPR) repeat protein
MRSDSPLQEALALHRRGDLDGAIARYDAVLRADPQNVDALHHLAMARCQRGQFAEGIETIGRALALAPSNAAAHNLLGMALARIGRTREAVASFDRAVALQENFAEVHGNRAGALAELGTHDEALKAYDRALALDPASVGDWINLGALQFELGLHDKAISSFDRALALQPNIPEAHANRANALRALGRNAEALAGYDRALALRPNFAEAIVSRGLIHLTDERSAQALQDFDRVLAINPAHAAAWRHRGAALSQLDRFADAIVSCERALALDPNDIMSHFIRGLALFNLGRDGEALASLDRVVEARPGDARAHSERAAILNALDRVDEAFAGLTEALSLDPDNPFVAGVAGDIYLLRSRWTEGWPLYERRFEIDPAGILAVHGSGLPAQGRGRAADLADFPRWRGEPPDGRPLVLVTEQGLGDAIQFARFATELADRGHRVTVMTAPALAPLLATVPGVDRVCTRSDQIGELNSFCWSPFLSLPALIGLTPQTIPARIAYISVEEARVEAWRARIGPDGFKIGLAWQGNPNFRFDRGRSIALTEFAPLAGIPGVRLISLQKQPGADQVAGVSFGDRIETPADPADRGATALLDLAAMMQALDLVVTSDSMPAHLAGALGVPTFVALRRRMLDWRWLPGYGERSPWYPTLRLYRQSSEGDWASVFTRIAADVSARAAGGDGRRRVSAL